MISAVDTIMEQTRKKSSSVSILLVEDNPNDARRLRELLAEESTFGFELREVASMSAAESYLAVEIFDIIVLDLFLPDSSGMETYERARVAAPHTPILILTILDNHLLADSLLKDGAAGYFVKGAEGQKGFIDAIHSVVDRNNEFYSAYGTSQEK